MNHVGVIETAHHMDKCIRLTDIGKKFVSETFSMTCAAHQSRNIHKFHHCGRFFIGLINFRQTIQTAVRHGNDSHIGFNRTEGIIGTFRPGICNGVEQS